MKIPREARPAAAERGKWPFREGFPGAGAVWWDVPRMGLDSRERRRANQCCVAFLEGEFLAKEAGLSQGVRCHSGDGIKKYQQRWVRQMGF